jgi:hypothetical protein
VILYSEKGLGNASQWMECLDMLQVAWDGQDMPNCTLECKEGTAKE